jgi:serine protease AprX
VLDSGVAPNKETPVTYFKDFLVPDKAHMATDTPCATPCDTNGHGTHVAGTIAGNGFNSFGERAGMAPGASIIALRVLGADGTGTVDGVVNAMQWILGHARRTSASSTCRRTKPTNRSMRDPDPMATLLDPLALATKRLVDAGIFVVAASGNVGQIDSHPAGFQ